ncbi:immunoglobulin superfamily member 10-like isoform X2 [Rhopilema esculentum]|uniref:immunoglobulin superfamily member 10-like isoform X2 n=1 Tax=Rhopilema esculentum TaxID=499914 RepID=UPI0031CFC652
MTLYKCLFCHLIAYISLQIIMASVTEETSPSRTLIDVKNITAVAGKDKRLLLSCPYFKSIPIFWKKDGRVIQETRSMRISLGTLMVTTVSLAAEGQYECNFQDLDGNGYRAIFNVTINETPRISQRSKRHIYSNGSATVLNCKANGKPKPDVFWINEKGLSPISPPTITLVSETSLKISRWKRNKSSVFICIAQNKYGRAKVMFKIPAVGTSASKKKKAPKKSVERKGKAPEFISLPPKILPVALGTRLEINCNAKGEPKPKIIITKLRPSKQILQTSVIGRLQFRNIGLYECRAVNDYGTIKHTFLLRLKGFRMKARYRFNTKGIYNSYARGYTNWSNWSRCSNQCGIGVQVRSRKCRVTDLRYKAKYCTKQTTIRRMCFERKCYKKS